MITLSIKYRYLVSKQLKKDGTAVIYIRAYQVGGGKKMFPTGISVKPCEWDEKNKRLTKAHPRFRELNEKLRNQLNAMESFILEKEKRKDGALPQLVDRGRLRAGRRRGHRRRGVQAASAIAAGSGSNRPPFA